MFSRDRSNHPATTGYFAWGCFRYFSWERGPPSPLQSVFAFASLKLRRTPRFALQAPCGCVTRGPKGGDGLPSRSSRPRPPSPKWGFGVAAFTRFAFEGFVLACLAVAREARAGGW